jgi:hypothetical protein
MIRQFVTVQRREKEVNMGLFTKKDKQPSKPRRRDNEEEEEWIPESVVDEMCERREREWDRLYRGPADARFVEAVAHLQRGWRNNTRIGTAGRYNRRGWQALMQVILTLPPLP